MAENKDDFLYLNRDLIFTDMKTNIFSHRASGLRGALRLMASVLTTLIFCGVSVLFTSCANNNGKTGCVGGNDLQITEAQIDSLIASLSIREKVGMMFYVKPE